MTPNIPLTRSPRVEDFEDIYTLAKEECYCTSEMKADLEHGDETVCQTCAARQILNGLTTLADEISE